MIRSCGEYAETEEEFHADFGTVALPTLYATHSQSNAAINWAGWRELAVIMNPRNEERRTWCGRVIRRSD